MRGGADRRQRTFDWGPRAQAIPLAPRRAVAPSPDYREMEAFVRRVRSNGLEPLEQLKAMVNYAVTDLRLTSKLEITDDDLPFGL